MIKKTFNIHLMGFTLAEVLITLGIIGIVAAMTIPTLMGSYQKQEYVTRLKKAYTTMNQALMQMANDHNCAGDLRCTGLFDFGTSNQDIGDELVKYFKVAKNCRDYNTTPMLGCYPDNITNNYDGTNPDTGWDHWNYRFITLDGISFEIMSDSDNCADLGWSSHVTNNMSQICGTLYIDVNGQQSPNRFGRDIHAYYITNGKGPLLYPASGVDDSFGGYWKTTGCYGSNTRGDCCVARIMEEGWQMTY